MQYTSKEDGPFIGDQIYVWLSVAIMAMILVAIIVVISAMTGSTSGGRFEGNPAVSLFTLSLCLCPLFVAWGIVLKGIYEGRKWAFIFELVTTIIFVALPNSGASQTKFAAASSIGLLLTIARCVYYAMRLSGAVGPPLR